MLELKNVTKTFFAGTANEKKALRGVSFTLEDGDFCTVIGSNGAGKSTTLNAIAGAFPIDSGSILIDGVDVSRMPEYKRAAFIGRVFQDPMRGTAAGMMISENLAIADRRGRSQTLRWSDRADRTAYFTELGTAVRATGFNPQMARAQGINTNTMVVLGLVISNGLVALSGATVAQANGFADVGMGVGTIVIGLASVIIGEVLFSPKTFKTSLAAVILGSIIYRLVIAFVLEMGMPPNDLKLFTAVLVAIALALPLIKEKMAGLRARA